jgi:CheY-like chemotaxis protein
MKPEAIRRVLLVDDDQEILFIAKMALESLAGYSVCTCSSGPEAVERAPTFSPDLLLLDIMMPEMTGPETLAALRGIPALAETPAIFLTALGSAGEGAAPRSLGVAGVIMKPFDPLTLADRIREHLGGAPQA